MRRYICLICMPVFLLLVLLFAPCAMANGWGLSGPLLNAVSGTHLYDEYSASALFYSKDILPTAAVMESRYHAFLWIYGKDAAGNPSLWRSTTAVYQPGETDAKPVISCTEDTVTMSWPDLFSTFVFSWDSNENTWILTRAEAGGLQIALTDGRYVTGAGNVWQAGPVDIQSFTVSQFPRTEYDVLSMNRVYALLAGSSSFWRENVTAPGQKRIPVYSAPDEGSYRAANGKAAVSGDENFLLLASTDRWDLVEYEVSLRTHRIGWIHDVSLGKTAPIVFTDVAAAACDFLTDDPFCSQYPSFTGNDLTEVHLLGQANAFYAYASAKTTAGQEASGFVPIIGCRLYEEKVEKDIMAMLCGTWFFSGGGNLTADVLRLHPDGTCELFALAEEDAVWHPGSETGLPEDVLDHESRTQGNWYAAENRIGDGCPYALVLRVQGTYQVLSIYALPQEEGRTVLTLVQGEAGGTWSLAEKEDGPVTISEIAAGYTDETAGTAAYGFGYDQLSQELRPFFPEDIWGQARFMADSEYEYWSAYHEEKEGKPYTIYPVVTVRDGVVQLHVFQRATGTVTRVTETNPEAGLLEIADRRASAPRYSGSDGIGQMDGLRHYRETINLYFDGYRDPWNIQIVFEKEDPEDPEAWKVQAVVYQYQVPRKTPVQEQLYDHLVIHPDDGTLSYGYGYEEEMQDDGIALPLTCSTRLSDFRFSDYPEDPEMLMRLARVNTRKHGNGGRVNMRTAPEKNGKALAQIGDGEEIRALELENGWCFVKYGERCGYVMAEFVEGTGRYLQQ